MGRYFALVFAILTVSCASSVDVTNDSRFNFGYQKGQMYLSKQPLFLLNRPNNHIAIPGDSYPEMDKYLENRKKYKEIKGVIDKNEKIMIEKLIYKENFEDSYLKVYGTLLSGRYEGEIVNLNSISRWVFKSYPMGGSMPTPDPKIIELVE